jgi:hypothetical protein
VRPVVDVERGEHRGVADAHPGDVSRVSGATAPPVQVSDGGGGERELADGLQETYRRYLGQGMAPDAAAEAATEFGSAELIAAHFTRVHPARRAARAMMTARPAVGACWAAALVTGRAWTWLVPLAARRHDPADLAAALVTLASASISTTALTAGGPTAIARIQRLLAPPRRRGSRSGPCGWPAGLAALMIPVVITSVPLASRHATS